MIQGKIVGLLMLCGLTSCSRPVPPENTSLRESIQALEQAKAVQSQVMQQAEQQKRQLEAAEK